MAFLTLNQVVGLSHDQFDKIMDRFAVLISQGERIMKSEAEVKSAITDAVAQVKATIAAAIAKEKAEVIAAIKALPTGGITDEALADIVASVSSIGSSTVGAVDTISTDATAGTVVEPPAPPANQP